MNTSSSNRYRYHSAPISTVDVSSRPLLRCDRQGRGEGVEGECAHLDDVHCVRDGVQFIKLKAAVGQGEDVPTPATGHACGTSRAWG